MITAHAPAGYILSRLWPKAQFTAAAAFIGAVLPDIDLIWFYLIDNRAIHHHRYWVHAPGFWALIALPALPLIARFARPYLPAAFAFFAGLFVHLCLDTIAGDIMWHWPFSDAFTHLITVTPRYENWILNFILHPVFILELLIWAAALWIGKRP